METSETDKGWNLQDAMRERMVQTLTGLGGGTWLHETKRNDDTMSFVTTFTYQPNAETRQALASPAKQEG